MVGVRPVDISFTELKRLHLIQVSAIHGFPQGEALSTVVELHGGT